MAYSSSSLIRNGIICISLALFLSRGVLHVTAGCYTSIISFGDSLADTGNLLHMSESSNNVFSSVPPYGETFFHHPTGRFSDGRLIIDFIALSLGLPLVQPYFSGKGMGERNFVQGVNFAVAGATAVDFSFYQERGIFSEVTNVSLRDELDWFNKEMLPSFCGTPSECEKYLQSSLILMGEIGGNDYNDPFLQGHSIEEIQSFVPNVVATIGAAINELIELGAQTLVVPGVMPFGCSPSYLALFMNSTTNDYDNKTGCINWLNEFSEYHNVQLQKELHRLRELHPKTTIIYADYYNAAMELYSSPSNYGFNNTQSACCGGGGPYNYDTVVKCGQPKSTVCDDPTSYVNWDGIHLTEAAYEVIAQGLLHGPYTSPHVNELCILEGSRVQISDH